MLEASHLGFGANMRTGTLPRGRARFPSGPDDVDCQQQLGFLRLAEHAALHNRSAHAGGFAVCGAGVPLELHADVLGRALHDPRRAAERDALERRAARRERQHQPHRRRAADVGRRGELARAEAQRGRLHPEVRAHRAAPVRGAHRCCALGCRRGGAALRELQPHGTPLREEAARAGRRHHLVGTSTPSPCACASGTRGTSRSW